MAETQLKARVKQSCIIHTYAELWHASRCVLLAGQKEAKGSNWQFLSSAILTAFAFEGYLNHIGVQLDMDWERVEREPPLTKFDWICQRLNIEFPKGKRPRQTLEELFKFRSDLAHPRTVQIAPAATMRDLNDKLDEHLGERPLAHWEQLIKTDDFAMRAREDVEAILGVVHKHLPDPQHELFALGMSLSSATPLEDDDI